jgi:predicted transcriptional regulator
LEVKTLSNSRIAKLISTRDVRFLTPFMGADCTISAAAKHVKVDIHTMYRRAKQLERFGIITPSLSKKRSGKPVVSYRATADKFFIPQTVISLDDHLREQFNKANEQFLSGITQTLQRDGGDDLGICVYKSDNGFMRVDVAALDGSHERPKGRPQTPAIGSLSYLNLTPAKADALRGELVEVMNRYRDEKGDERFFLRIQMTKLWDS